jgi:putative intracellular protease/amidase
LVHRHPGGVAWSVGGRAAILDKLVRELGITFTPQHPKRELRQAGALFESETAFRDIFANHVVVDGNMITGQNQNAGAEVAQRMMEIIEQKVTR